MVSTGSSSQEVKGYELWYVEQYGETEDNQLSVDTEGNVSAFINYSQPGSPVRDLGVYYQALGHDDTDLSRIGNLIRQKGLTEGTPFLTQPRFGMRSRIFQFTADGGKVTHHLDVLEPLPEKLTGVQEAVHTLFSKLIQGPLRTLSAHINMDPNPITVGDKMKIILEFRNRGKFPTEFRNPASFNAGGSNMIKINVWKRYQNEEGRQVDEYQWSLDLAGNEFLTAERQALSADNPILTIPPGGTLQSWTTIQFPKSEAGDYLAEFIYYAVPVTSPEKEMYKYLVVGEYHADLKQLTVRKK